MCNPILAVAALSAAIGIGQTVSEYQGKMQQAHAQTAAANRTYALRSDAISAQAAQLSSSQTEDAVDREIESARARGRIANSVSDMGLGGMTSAQLLNTQSFETGRAQSLQDIDFAQQRDQLSRDSFGASIERTSNQGVKPSSLSLILGIASSVVQGANTYTNIGGRLPGGATRAG